MHPNSSASIYILHSGYSDPPFLAASANPKNNSGVNKWFGGWGGGGGGQCLNPRGQLRGCMAGNDELKVSKRICIEILDPFFFKQHQSCSLDFFSKYLQILQKFANLFASPHLGKSLSLPQQNVTRMLLAKFSHFLV